MYQPSAPPPGQNAPFDFAQAQGNTMAAGLANEVLSSAQATAKETLGVVQHYLQKGPGSEGVGWLCCVGGLATTAVGAFGLLDVFSAIFEPLEYLLNIYFLVFGMTTCVLEAPDDWLRRSGKLLSARQFLETYTRFLATRGGRGVFYLFQGSLWISLGSTMSISFVLGMYLLFLGLLNIALQYQMVPENIIGGPPGSRQTASRRGDAYVPSSGGDYIHLV
mmetsp:Transcript_8462/g.15978  ORF Transcript_8462/g.15978 Transcript_8462/m.15978 type:complete len:220 (-) Transcript_8462:88-747(-)